MTVPSVAVATMKFLLGLCNCMVDIDAGLGDFGLMLGDFCVCGHTHMLVHMPLDTDLKYNIMLVWHTDFSLYSCLLFLALG